MYARGIMHAVVIYVGLVAMVLICKPSLVYNQQKGEYRQFGSGEGETFTPLWMLFLLAAICAYLLAKLSSHHVSVSPHRAPAYGTTPHSPIHNGQPPIQRPASRGGSVYRKAADTHGSMVPNSKLWNTAMNT